MPYLAVETGASERRVRKRWIADRGAGIIVSSRRRAPGV
jgi:hypothetical protein